MKDNKIEKSTEKEVVEKDKISKWPTVLLVLIIVGVLGFVGSFVYKMYLNDNPKPIGESFSQNDETKRETIPFLMDSLEILNEESKEHEEINHAPYNEGSLRGGQVVWDQNMNGHGIDSFKDLKYNNGKLEWRWAAFSLRTIEDEKVNPEEVYGFNNFWNAVSGINDMGNETLNKEEVIAMAEDAEYYASEEKNPAALYIGDLIKRLKDSNPTKQSIYYLMMANRIKPYTITNGQFGNEDYSRYFDRSYSDGNKERTLVTVYTDNFEKVNKSKGLVHWYFDGSMSHYGIDNAVASASTSYAASSRDTEVKEGLLQVGHYKDISNYMLAEYFVMNGNMGSEIDAQGLNEFNISSSKPAFTWCISPKIEEIATEYYDIVEPLVYTGKFQSREDAYAKTKEALDNKYSQKEIQSAIMTYEFWALQP